MISIEINRDDGGVSRMDIVKPAPEGITKDKWILYQIGRWQEATGYVGLEWKEIS